MESPKIAVAQRVAQLFAIGGVALPHETTAGIAAVAQPCQSQKFAATPRIGIYEMTSELQAISPKCVCRKRRQTCSFLLNSPYGLNYKPKSIRNLREEAFL